MGVGRRGEGVHANGGGSSTHRGAFVTTYRMRTGQGHRQTGLLAVAMASGVVKQTIFKVDEAP